MKRILLAAIPSAALGLGSLGLGACASHPTYALAPSAEAPGYREQQIERDHWRVSYTGTRRMSADDVHDHALMRAAQLTLEHGASWFEVVSSNTNTQLKNNYTRQVNYTPDYAVKYFCSPLICTEQTLPVMRRTESERVETRAISHQTLEIRFGPAEEPRPSRAYDAGDTFATLKARLS